MENRCVLIKNQFIVELFTRQKLRQYTLSCWVSMSRHDVKNIISAE